MALPHGALADVSSGDVATLGAYTQAFEKRLGRPTQSDQSARAQAGCLLGAFDAHGGDEAQSALMDMMQRVAGQSEFDDPLVVSFNEAYGAVYARALRQCAP
ncbi:MAG: hypothetical protein AAGA78_14700 [Pseudomonadota bacterium]